MSEGDIWLHKAVHEVTLAIRLSSFITGAPGLEASQGPVARADSMMREFCTKELRNVQGGAFGVEAYIANATMDLVIMATWALMIEQIPDAEPLPVCQTISWSMRYSEELYHEDIYVRAGSTHLYYLRGGYRDISLAAQSKDAKAAQSATRPPYRGLRRHTYHNKG